MAPEKIKKLQFWTAFVNYAKNEHGRSNDIAKQKAAGRTYYDVHIGARTVIIAVNNFQEEKQ